MRKQDLRLFLFENPGHLLHLSRCHFSRPVNLSKKPGLNTHDLACLLAFGISDLSRFIQPGIADTPPG